MKNKYKTYKKHMQLNLKFMIESYKISKNMLPATLFKKLKEFQANMITRFKDIVSYAEKL